MLLRWQFTRAKRDRPQFLGGSAGVSSCKRAVCDACAQSLLLVFPAGKSVIHGISSARAAVFCRRTCAADQSGYVDASELLDRYRRHDRASNACALTVQCGFEFSNTVVSALYQTVMMGWRSLLGVRKGFKSVVTCLVVGSLAVLAGLFSLTASKITQHRWFCKNFRDIQPRSQGTQGTLPIRIFSAESNQILRGGQGRQPNLLERDGIAGTVTRSENPSLLSRADVNVPQTIWRTARSRQGTPEFATDLFNSWTKFNPGWDQYFMDDEDVEAFVAAHYNDTVLQAFKDLPLGVMKADLFRYASLRNATEMIMIE